jgi:DNA-binding response OmpR family regulator
MDKINLLVANSERGLSNLIERIVLDACYNQAVVESTRISRGDELVKLGCSASFQLLIVAADNLLNGTGLRSSCVSAAQAAGAIRLIRERTTTPLIAVAAFAQNQVALLEAGADCVVRLPFESEKLRTEVRRVLRLPEVVEEPAPERARWTLTDFLARGLQRLKSA